ncbi:hypothetical protein B0H14DRAFT_2606304 [Mycena olivaceomarginata]|nr:hypothetical protein B0H14DRAFT_2606304 [Mycena olivaceomarginata]
MWLHRMRFLLAAGCRPEGVLWSKNASANFHFGRWDSHPFLPPIQIICEASILGLRRTDLHANQCLRLFSSALMAFLVQVVDSTHTQRIKTFEFGHSACVPEALQNNVNTPPKPTRRVALGFAQKPLEPYDGILVVHNQMASQPKYDMTGRQMALWSHSPAIGLRFAPALGEMERLCLCEALARRSNFGNNLNDCIADLWTRRLRPDNN